MIRHTLIWEPLAGFPGYELEIATDDAFTQFIQTVSYTTETSVVTDPLGASTYYWRVRGVGLLLVGEWSATRSFVIHAPWTQPTYDLVPTPWCYPILLRRA